MTKAQLKALKVGDTVIVNGKMDGQVFAGDRAEIVDVTFGEHAHSDGALLRFATWADGHGEGEHCWYFRAENARVFTITKEVPAVAAKPKKAPHGKQEYKGNGKHEWEVVTIADDSHSEAHRSKTTRLRVPGGWLYRDSSECGTMAFVPAPEVIGYAI